MKRTQSLWRVRGMLAAGMLCVLLPGGALTLAADKTPAKPAPAATKSPAPAAKPPASAAAPGNAAPATGTNAQLGGTVTGGEFVKWPLAIPALKNFGTQPDSENMSQTGQTVLSTDLDIAGVFEILNPKSFIEKPGQTGVTAASINWSDWLNVGANGLIKGGFTIDGDKVKLDLRLYDVALGKQVVGKQYEGPRSQFRSMLHRFAAEVISYFTNGKVKGVFNTKIACVHKTPSGKEIYLMDFDGYGGYYLTENNSLNLLPSWDHNGARVLFTSYIKGDPNIYAVAPGEPNKLEPVSVTKGLDMGAAVSPDGSRIALSLTKDDNAEIYVMNHDGSGLTRLTTSWGIDISPTWSPDGKKIAFVSNRSGNPHLYLMDANGENQERLTFVGTYNQSPSWSPKGDRIVFVGRDERYVFDIFTISVVDRMDVKRLTQDQGNNENPSFSPDGRLVVFSSNRTGEYKIYIMNADGTGQRMITPAKGQFTTPSWSPWMPW